MKRYSLITILLVLIGQSLAPGSLANALPEQGAVDPGRLERLVEANIMAAHAYQTVLAIKSGKRFDSFPTAGRTESSLMGLVAHQESLLKSDLVQVLAWTRGEPTTFDPASHLSPILEASLKLDSRLPVNVYTDYLLKVPGVSRIGARTVASLYQVCLEVDRDGTLLWDLMDFYQALGLPVYVGQFGLPGTDQDFLSAGEQLAKSSCEAPFPDSPTTAFAWQICARKIWNWGLKNLHLRDQFVMARELLEEPDVRVLIPLIKALPLQKIAIVGHSFTMQSHWSSPGSFASVVGAVLAMTQPGIQYRQWASGGLTATRAFKSFYADVLAWKPDLVLFAVAFRTDKDRADFRTMCRGLGSAGVQVCMFDNLKDPSDADGLEATGWGAAKDLGLTVIPVESLLAGAPEKDEFLCLDKIHMTEPYHRLMARQWLKFLTEQVANQGIR